MAEVLDVIAAFSSPLKLGWVVWIAWGVAQVFWYRHELGAATFDSGELAESVEVSEPEPDPVVHRLVTLEPAIVTDRVTEPPDHAAADVRAVEAEPELGPDRPPGDQAPVAAADKELDSFIADFEMSTWRRGEDRSPEPTDASSAL